jgi:hypothetical protein
MKHILLPLFILLSSSCLLTAQEYGLYFMPDVWNSNYINPGFMPRQNVVVSLPSIHTSINAIGVNKANVLRHDATDDVYYLNYAEVIDRLERDVTLKSSSVIDAMAIGFKINKLFLSFSTNTCIDGDFTAPQDFFRFIWEGTANNLNQPLDIGPSLNFMAYQKIGLGGNYAIKPNLSVGMRINRLLGLGSFQTDNSQLAITQNSEFYQTQFQVDYMVNYYAAGALDPLDVMTSGATNFGDEIGDFEFSTDGGLSGITNKNNGWSVDLGAEYFHNQKLSFAASIINLGAINWKNNTQRIHITEDYTYAGLETSDINDDESISFDAVSDTLETLFDFEAVSNQSFRQGLAPRTYISARYQPASFITVGGLIYNEFTSFGTFTGISLNTRLLLGRIFSVGGGYTVQSGTYNNFGLNTALKLGPFQIYAIADNIAPLVNPERVDGTNFRVGLNLTFGRKKTEKALAANLDSLQREALYADTPEDFAESVINNQEENEEEPLVIVEEEVVSNNSDTPSEKEVKRDEKKEDQETVASTKTKKPKATKEKKRKTEAVSNAPVSPNPVAQAKAVNVYELQTSFLDAETNELVDAAYVDIYRLDGQGNKILVRTGRYDKGQMAVLLNTSESMHELYASVYGYEPISLLFTPSAGGSLEPSYLLEKSESEETVATASAVDEIAEVEIDNPVQENDDMPLVSSSNPDSVEEEVSSTPAPIMEEEPVATATSPATAPGTGTKPQVQVTTPVRKNRTYRESIPKGEFFITQKTSLRSHPDSQSDVLRRLAVGTELELLDKTNEYWWLVSCRGQEGWVKAHLLRPL